MKRVLLFVFALLFSFNVKAQTSLTEAVDFQSIDDYGTNVHLFEILERGQNVVMYFFFSDAETSPYFDPNIAQAYHHFGDNQGDVYFVGVAPSDDSLSIANWRMEYEVDFPVINRISVGDDAHEICEDYGVIIFSTFVLIAPDKRILIDNIWPIMDAQELIAEIEDKMVVDNIAEVNDESLGLYPNPATSFVNIKSSASGSCDINIFDMTGRCVKSVYVEDVSDAIINIEDLDKGVYFIELAGKVEKLIIE
ncbi:MAG: T9SS type A sorting domain-containing protein [Bacteroidales bacterium]|nr:T9SS type A sorting domain-containing protein [Bacteroidales bacterium]MBR5604767.1 T9SS type A sorting domain-containing protein [Bacteroidales bacterium]MBR5781755.1 T9SS type A sorting domain-containing protein [Bacteroidales bacterium]